MAKILVSDLRKILDEVPAHYLVVLSSDEEGNEFKPLSQYSVGRYDPVEQDLLEGTQQSSNCVVFWPA